LILLKHNEIALEFCQLDDGFSTMIDLLSTECIKSTQIAYNVVCGLWILSYHKFARKLFAPEDFNNNVIAQIIKILDYFNKENIVRIILMVLDNLKHDSNCLELMSLCDCAQVVIKLQKKPWVDTDIEPLLEKLFDFFAENAQELSSIEKWKKQIERDILVWSPVHTEKFWMDNANLFKDDNLEYINKLIEVLNPSRKRSNLAKAVACSDLGNFARFSPNGKAYLENKGGKDALGQIMSDKSASPELKKEAITAY
jgi:V-type H+-transporting ATPase subunit H